MVKLIKELLKNKFKCQNCNHLFNEKELEYLIGNSEDNQNCPKCKYLIT